jgi:hypothetical protein
MMRWFFKNSIRTTATSLGQIVFKLICKMVKLEGHFSVLIFFRMKTKEEDLPVSRFSFFLISKQVFTVQDLP